MNSTNTRKNPCDCFEAGDRFEVLRNSQLVILPHIQNGIEVHLRALTFAQEFSTTYWRIRFAVTENANDLPIRRLAGNFLFTAGELVPNTRLTLNVVGDTAPCRLGGIFAELTTNLGSSQINITGTISVGTLRDSRQSNVVKLPTTFAPTASWIVERRCVAGVRHSRLCVNLPYMYCQARTCFDNGDCTEWEHESDSCDPITCP